jgi:hypothetical protein
MHSEHNLDINTLIATDINDDDHDDHDINDNDADDDFIEDIDKENLPENLIEYYSGDSFQILESPIVAIEQEMHQVNLVKQSLSGILNDTSKQLLPYTYIPEGCDWYDFVKSHFSFQCVIGHWSVLSHIGPPDGKGEY